MHRFLTLVVLLSAPLVAQAASGDKPTNQQNYAQEQQQKNNTGAFAWIKRNLIPTWKTRFLERRDNLDMWNKPNGGHFTTPSVTTSKPGFVKRTIVVVKQRTGMFFQRLRAAWRSRWGNRNLNADRQSALQNQAGFGDNVRRSQRLVAYSWRTRFDVGKRLRPKPTTSLRRTRRPKRFRPRPPPHRPPPHRRYRQPPPPGWR
jgi:hypothetical protein